jgi:hypothetical protein
MREERAFHQFAVLDWRQALPFPGSHTINKSAAEFGPGGATPKIKEIIPKPTN